MRTAGLSTPAATGLKSSQRPPRRTRGRDARPASGYDASDILGVRVDTHVGQR